MAESESRGVVEQAAIDAFGDGDRTKRREAEIQLAAFMGDAQLDWFSEHTICTDRLDYLRRIEARNPLCLRVHKGREPRRVVVVSSPKVEEVSIGLAVGYTLVIPLTAKFDELLLKDEMTYFTASFVAQHARECIAGPGEAFTTLLIDEIVSFPYSKYREEITMDARTYNATVISNMFQHIMSFLSGVNCETGGCLQYPDGRPLPRLVAWAQSGDAGAHLARRSGFREVWTGPSRTGAIYSRFTLDLSEVDPERLKPLIRNARNCEVCMGSRNRSGETIPQPDSFKTYLRVLPDTWSDKTKYEIDSLEASVVFDRMLPYLKQERVAAQMHVAESLRAFFKSLAGKRFTDFEQNRELAKIVNELAEEAGCELRYNGQVVSIECRKSNERSKFGAFFIRVKGTSRRAKSQVAFPSLELVPMGMPEGVSSHGVRWPVRRFI